MLELNAIEKIEQLDAELAAMVSFDEKFSECQLGGIEAIEACISIQAQRTAFGYVAGWLPAQVAGATSHVQGGENFAKKDEPTHAQADVWKVECDEEIAPAKKRRMILPEDSDTDTSSDSETTDSSSTTVVAHQDQQVNDGEFPPRVYSDGSDTCSEEWREAEDGCDDDDSF